MASAAPVPCILCRGNAAVTLVEKIPGYAILFCAACRLRFSDPMSHPGQAFYEESALYDNRQMDGVSLSLPRLEWRYTEFLRRARPQAGMKLLDLGCGDGGMLSLAASRGLDPYGLELDSRGVAIARQARKLRHVEQGRFEKAAELGWRDFDFVTCMEVMEHVPDPAHLAGLIHGLLRPGGLAGISVPSWDRRPAWFDRKTDYPPHHFTLWTREALQRVLKDAGFEAVEVLEAPVTLQNFLYAALSRLKGAKETEEGQEPMPSNAAEPPAGKRAEASPAGSAPGAVRLNRPRILAKAILYRAFNLANPALGAMPFLRGHTLLALGRRPG